MDLDKYSREKAEEVFKTLPYTTASDNVYKDHIRRRPLYRRFAKNFLNIATKAAAVLFIPVTVYALYHHFNPRTEIVKEYISIVPQIPDQLDGGMEYITNPGVKGKVMLPDSSEVWVNSCSSLKVPSKFDSTARYIELSGEAYFKVKSHKHWPMYIKTPQGVVTKVLGTEFNLSAYNNDAVVKLTLVNGKVELIKNNKKAVQLLPNEQITIFNNQPVAHKKEKIRDIEGDIAWKDGYLIFENTPMSDVIKKLERWYGVNVTIRSKEILDLNFTARFKSESVTQVLDLLKISSNIGYRIDKNRVILY